MDLFRLEDFTGGWVAGDFAPSLLRTDAFEVAVKRYRRGDTEAEHYQLSAVEVTIIVAGRCRIGAHELGPDDIIRIEPFEPAAFEALDDVVLVAFKAPSLPADKVIGRPGD